MEVAKLIKDEDGVTAAIDAFHRHLPSELLLPTPSPVEDHPNALQWFFLQISKWCYVPCGGTLRAVILSFSPVLRESGIGSSSIMTWRNSVEVEAEKLLRCME
ncbi:hypothetical protein HN873_004787 [Arachis hypogaea]